MPPTTTGMSIPRPYALLAEITHRCPLHCPYCSNPTQLALPSSELSTDEWKRVLAEAAELGVLHVGFSGGEPLQRADLTELVRAARAVGLYSNLITSSLGFTRRRAEEKRPWARSPHHGQGQSSPTERADPATALARAATPAATARRSSASVGWAGRSPRHAPTNASSSRSYARWNRAR